MLSGEGTLIVEGAERPLRQWDFVHWPPEDTQESSLAYARFPPLRAVRYPGGLPPGT